MSESGARRVLSSTGTSDWPMVRRRPTRAVSVAGRLIIGGGAPISVQTMTKTDTRDVAATTEQIRALEEAGADLIRLAVPDAEAAEALGPIVKRAKVPLVADIHFDYRLALVALERGVAKLRINPGNIGGPDRVQTVAKAARARGVPIRIGVNSGSLEKPLLAKYGRPTPEAMVESALGHIRLLEDEGFADIVVSLKSSDVATTVAAYRLAAESWSYPLHLGITEAGGAVAGTAKSAVGLALLLAEGIGDTLRVSLTGETVAEVRAGQEILRSLQLRNFGVNVISCPTCGRCEIDLAAVATEVERRLGGVKVPLTVSILGCAVNGPGEAAEADVGLAGGKQGGLLFRHGRVVGRVSEEEMVDAFVELVQKVAEEKRAELGDEPWTSRPNS